MNEQKVLPGHSNEEILHLARQANRGIFYRYLALVSVLALGIIGVFSYQGYQAVHNTQVQTCEHSKQPGGVRYILATQIREDLARGQSINLADVAKRLGVPVSVLTEQRQGEKQEVKDLLGVDCQHP